MAAPKYTDRILAQEVRSLALKEMKAVLLSEDDKEFKKALLLKLASSVLPRLNEVTGEGGGAVIIQVAKEGIEKYNLDESPSGTSADTLGQAPL